MLTLKKYIQKNKNINEGIFDVSDVTYKTFRQANETLEIVNIENSLTRDNAELEKIFFNIDLKLEDGTTVKDSVNNNKAEFKKWGLANYVDGINTQDMTKLIANNDKADKEVGEDTMGTADGSLLIRYLKINDNQQTPMVIIKFKK